MIDPTRNAYAQLAERIESEGRVQDFDYWDLFKAAADNAEQWQLLATRMTETATQLLKQLEYLKFEGFTK